MRAAIRAIALIGCMLALVGCDSAGVDGPGDTGAPPDTLWLTPREAAEIETARLRVGTSRGASIQDVTWWEEDKASAEPKWPAPNGGLWLAAEQDGPRSAVATTRGPNHFEFASVSNGISGILAITEDSVGYTIANWPATAPVNQDGSPRLYGDRMLWALHQPGEPAFTMIQGVRVASSIYLFDTGPLESVAFHRHDITNISDAALANLYIGYGGDPDINGFGASLGEGCQSLNHYSNQAGYDPEHEFVYTYISPFPEDGGLPAHCYGDVYAFAILPMTTTTGIGRDKLASRIIRRGGAPSALYPGFSENHFTSPDVMLRALQGLSYLGDHMIDPTSGAKTNYAFTGDPVNGTGWLDERHDVRSLLSLEPVTLPAGETLSVTVVWLFASENTLAEGLARVRRLYETVLENQAAWDY